MEKVTLLRLLQLKVRLDTKSPFKDLNHTLQFWKVAIKVVLRSMMAWVNSNLCQPSNVTVEKK